MLVSNGNIPEKKEEEDVVVERSCNWDQNPCEGKKKRDPEQREEPAFREQETLHSW